MFRGEPGRVRHHFMHVENREGEGVLRSMACSIPLRLARPELALALA
jgi:hypothetical protein